MDFDFLHLYEELSRINEEAVLDEATGGFGRYKKAFINFLSGVYYDINDADGHPTGADPRNPEAKEDEKDTYSNIQGTKYIEYADGVHDLPALMQKYKVEDHWFDEHGGQHFYDLSKPEDRRKIVQNINQKIRNEFNVKNGRVIQKARSKADKEAGKVSYSVYAIAPSALHHINGEHNDDVGIKSFTYLNKNHEKKTTTLVDLRDKEHAKNLGNYVLVEAVDPSAARYVHMIIHLLAMVAKVIGVGNKNMDSIIDAFAQNIEKKHARFTIVNGKKEKIVYDKLADFLNSHECFMNPATPLERLIQNTEDDLPIAAITSKENIDDAQEVETPIEAVEVNDKEEE